MGSLALGAAGFVLFGPRGHQQDARGRIVLDYWEKWTGHEANVMRRVVDAFNASQDRIVVRYLSMSGIDQKAMVAIVAGNPPDVLGLWNYSVPGFAESGAILPLDGLGFEKEVALERYAPGFRPIMTHMGKRYATINTGGTLALYYNKKLFREAGLDPERPPRTIGELGEYHKRLTKRDASGRLERVGFLHTEPGWWTWIWGYHFGGSMWDATSETSTVAGPTFLKGYDWVQSWFRDLGVADATTAQESFGNYDSPKNAFLTGQVAMVCQGPFLANVITVHGKDLDYGVAPFPVDDEIYRADEPVACVDTDILVIPKGAKNPEASMEFIAFTQRRENVELLASVHTKGSPMLDVSEAFVRNHPNRGVAVFNALASSPRTFRCPRTRTWTQLKAEFDGGAVRIRRLEKPAKDILSEVQARSQSILDRNAKARQARGGPGKGQMPVEAGA